MGAALWFSALELLTIALTCVIVGAGAPLVLYNNTKHHHRSGGGSKTASFSSADLVFSSVSLQDPDAWFIYSCDQWQIKNMPKQNVIYTIFSCLCNNVLDLCLIKTKMWCFLRPIRNYWVIICGNHLGNRLYNKQQVSVLTAGYCHEDNTLQAHYPKSISISDPKNLIKIESWY